MSLILAQIVVCLSKEDRDEAVAKWQNPFQFLTIETPITILSCKATPSNIYVPPYAVEPNTNAMPLQNLECDCVGSDSMEALAQVHKAEVQKTLPVESILPDNLARSFGFESNSNNIKPPPQAHISRWSFPDIFR